MSLPFKQDLQVVLLNYGQAETMKILKVPGSGMKAIEFHHLLTGTYVTIK